MDKCTERDEDKEKKKRRSKVRAKLFESRAEAQGRSTTGF